MQERRQEPRSPRSTFGALARAAIEHHVPEARAATAAWHLAPNHVWVRWPFEGRSRYLALVRHLDWLSAEAGLSSAPVAMESLAMHPGPSETEAGPRTAGLRVRLGDLLGEGDRWWRAGGREQELVERLEWMVLQTVAKAPMFFAHHFREAARR